MVQAILLMPAHLFNTHREIVHGFGHVFLNVPISSAQQQPCSTEAPHVITSFRSILIEVKGLQSPSCPSVSQVRRQAIRQKYMDRNHDSNYGQQQYSDHGHIALPVDHVGPFQGSIDILLLSRTPDRVMSWRRDAASVLPPERDPLHACCFSPSLPALAGSTVQGGQQPSGNRLQWIRGLQTSREPASDSRHLAAIDTYQNESCLVIKPLRDFALCG